MLSLLRKCRLCFRDPARVRAGDVAYNGALVAWFRCVIALPLPGRQQQSAGEVAQGWIGITTGVGGKELILAGVPPAIWPSPDTPRLVAHRVRGACPQDRGCETLDLYRK